MKMNDFSDVIQYVIPSNTEIVFNILSHIRNVRLMLLDGKAVIHMPDSKSSLALLQEYSIPVWECLEPSLKTKSGCNVCVRGNHYVVHSSQKGFLENRFKARLFIVSPSEDNYSFILDKDIQLEIFPLQCADPESYITIRITRGVAEISGYKLSPNTTYSLASYSSVLLKSSDGEPYSIWVQGLDRKVKLSLVDENYQMCMEAVKERIFNLSLLEQKFKHIGPTVLVLGAINAGKSSFCRSLVNDALDKRMTPIYVDLNSQRSLSVPGSLSITEIEGRTESPLHFEHGVQKLFHFGSVIFHSVNMLLYLHLVRNMGALLLSHQRNAKKSCLTIIDTVGSHSDNIEGINLLLNIFTVDLVVVMGDQQYYEKLKHTILKTVPSEFIPKPCNIEPPNDEYKSKYYQYKIEEYFACAIGRPYIKNVRTVKLDCFKIYKLNTFPTVYDGTSERIKDFKLQTELMAFNTDMINRLLAVSEAKNLKLSSIFKVKYYVCFTAIDMVSETADVMAPENEVFNGGILLMGFIRRHETVYDVTA